jgi:NAD(P)-dependent dehydrogenase (short-subunit alcohol dehydrogenase family)
MGIISRKLHFNSTEKMPSILVVGGAGCLGRAMLRKFAPTAASSVTMSVDLAPSSDAAMSVVIEGGSCAQAAMAAASKVGSYPAVVSLGLNLPQPSLDEHN